jgi:hypothetical protein
MTKLVKYDAMCRAIDAAYKVDEVKDIRDKAIALEHYTRLAHNVEAERQACEIRLRAERKAGKLLRAKAKAKGRLKRGKKLPRSPHVTTETLKDLGISKKQSSDWQRLADISEDDFERSLTGPARPTTAGIIGENYEPTRSTQIPVSSEALWLWGRLNDFERDGLLAKNPADVLETMVDHMKDSVHTLAPKVAAWLKRIGELR